ncbi:pyridoxal 5'-phosphate synthase [Deferribacteraceae bacterium V6Fe1]|nr:pyridoxal 5'-phosphate synthase [Deferribacteraceae bacterium V6Fe1]
MANLQNLPDSPFSLFESWFLDAVSNKILEPNSFTLATVGNNLRPSQRVVLLKSYDEQGFLFFTNVDTKKVRQINENSFVSAHFAWLELERQVRIEGIVKSMPMTELIKNFFKRGSGLKKGEWISVKSDIITFRRVVESKFDDMRLNINGIKNIFMQDIRCYVIEPVYFEFWQGCVDKFYESVEYFSDGESWNSKINS